MIALLALVSISFDASLRNVLQVLVSFSDDLRKLHGLLVDVIDFKNPSGRGVLWSSRDLI